MVGLFGKGVCSMDRPLRSVRRLAFAPKPLARGSQDMWQRLACQAYVDTELDYCADPVVLTDRLGLDASEADDCTGFEVIGDIIYYPPGLPVREHCWGFVRAAARTILRVTGHLVTDANVIGVSAAIALPKAVASRVSFVELAEVNPFVPIEILRQIYMGHHRSGEFRVA